MTAQTAKLPIWQTVRDAYRLVFGHFGGMWKAALIPTSLYVVLLGLIGYHQVATAESADADGAEANVLLLVAVLAAIVVLVPFLSQWHRVSLLGPEREPPRIRFRFGVRELRFLGHCLLLILIGCTIVLLPLLALVMSGGGEFAFIVGVGLALVMLYVIARLGLMLPATAMDRRTGLVDAWTRSKGNGVRIAVALFLAELPWRILNTIVETIAEQTGTVGLSLLYATVTVFTTIIGLAILASVLAVAYKTLAGLPEAVRTAV
ncbi:MAG: hypothetical protein QNJ94_22110 [Alphaproteobacteria bacterium]|nr:hypothetical protein [Alphaproteobacteria bacterium]